jgi:hypothetical protein
MRLLRAGCVVTRRLNCGVRRYVNVSEYIPDLIGGASTVAAAVIAVGAGIWGFFRQKEYELIQRRYLDEGLDVIISTAENALNTFHHNWARCLELLKSFRDVETIKPEELDHGFLHLPVDRFALSANYRVNQIVDSGIIWQVFQLVVAFSQRGNTIARDEIPAALKMKLTTGQIAASRQEMVDAAMEELKKLDDESHSFHVFIGEMQAIARLVEEQKFSLKQIRKLRKHSIVVGALKNLQEKYGDRLAGV